MNTDNEDGRAVPVAPAKQKSNTQNRRRKGKGIHAIHDFGRALESAKILMNVFFACLIQAYGGGPF